MQSPGRRSRRKAKLLEGRTARQGEGKRLRSAASCAVPSDTELCSVAGTRASVYEAQLRAQSRATPSYARWLERGQAFTKRSFVRSPERRRATFGGRPPPKLLRSFDSPRGGVIESAATCFTPPSGGVIESAATCFTPPSGGVRFAERIWWGWGLRHSRAPPSYAQRLDCISGIRRTPRQRTPIILAIPSHSHIIPALLKQHTHQQVRVCSSAG